MGEWDFGSFQQGGNNAGHHLPPGHSDPECLAWLSVCAPVLQEHLSRSNSLGVVEVGVAASRMFHRTVDDLHTCAAGAATLLGEAAVGFALDGIKLTFCEESGGEGASDAWDVDVSVENEAFITIEGAAVDHFRVLIALGFEGRQLGLL